MKIPNAELFKHGKDMLLNTLFPEGNICHLCGQPMLFGSEIWLCSACETALENAFLSSAHQSIFLDPMVPHSFAAFHYHSPVQELVHQLKYQSDSFAAAPLAEGMARVFGFTEDEALRRAELLIPIPLHPRREKERGYNQAALLGERLSSHIGLPQYPHALSRIRHTRPQVKAQGRDRRLRNMIGAFEVADIPSIYQKHILLIDDVCTTGATAIACAQVLLVCGAKQISLFTACRA